MPRRKRVDSTFAISPVSPLEVQEHLPVSDSTPEVEEVAISSPPPVVGPTRWRVGKAARIVIGGHFNRLPAGKVIDSRHYNPSTVEELRRQGVELIAIVE